MAGETRPRFNIESARPIYENACVSLAVDGRLSRLSESRPRRLEPNLWEALRVELQRRWREATGEEHAILTVEDPTHDR